MMTTFSTDTQNFPLTYGFNQAWSREEAATALIRSMLANPGKIDQARLVREGLSSLPMWEVVQEQSRQGHEVIAVRHTVTGQSIREDVYWHGEVSLSTDFSDEALRIRLRADLASMEENGFVPSHRRGTAVKTRGSVSTDRAMAHRAIGGPPSAHCAEFQARASAAESRRRMRETKWANSLIKSHRSGTELPVAPDPREGGAWVM